MGHVQNLCNGLQQRKAIRQMFHVAVGGSFSRSATRRRINVRSRSAASSSSVPRSASPSWTQSGLTALSPDRRPSAGPPSARQPSTGPPSAGPPSAGPPKISLFFPLFRPHFRSFSLSLWGSSRGILVVGPPGFHTTARELQTYTLEGPDASKTTNFAVGGRKKRNFGPLHGPPPCEPPILRTPTSSGPWSPTFLHPPTTTQYTHKKNLNNKFQKTQTIDSQKPKSYIELKP